MPPSLLEGVSKTGPTGAFFPDCPRLDREVDALHQLARSGAIPADVAERQINTYLLAAGIPGAPAWLRRKLVLPITDGPHHSLLPDLGHVVHHILAKCPLPGSLSAVLGQCIPHLRHTQQPVPFTDSQDVFLNLALALLIGQYQGGAVKRPGFRARAELHARVHAILTGPREAQTEFCKQHAHVLLLACMEYTARVIPAQMPPMAAFLTEKDPSASAYFRRIPALCDELRHTLDPPPDWPQIQAACVAITDKISRLKKTGAHPPPKEPPLDPGLLAQQECPVAEYWAVPRLLGPQSLDEYRLLGQGLGLHGPLLYHVQREVQVHHLFSFSLLQTKHTPKTRNPSPGENRRCTPSPGTCAGCRSAAWRRAESPTPVPRSSRRATTCACTAP